MQGIILCPWQKPFFNAYHSFFRIFNKKNQTRRGYCHNLKWSIKIFWNSHVSGVTYTSSHIFQTFKDEQRYDATSTGSMLDYRFLAQTKTFPGWKKWILFFSLISEFQQCIPEKLQTKNVHFRLPQNLS